MALEHFMNSKALFTPQNVLSKEDAKEDYFHIFGFTIENTNEIVQSNLVWNLYILILFNLYVR